MKKIVLAVLILSFFLAGCKLKENYALQASFTNELTTKNSIEATSDGVVVSIPFSDFSCNPASFKPTLDRQGNDFIILLDGEETVERCSYKFSATITGVGSGNYWLKVVYRQGETDQQFLYEQFKVK